MPTHSLTNFEIQKYCQNEPKPIGACSRYSLPKIKDDSYLIDFDLFKSIGIHCIGTYFDSFGVEHIPKRI